MKKIAVAAALGMAGLLSGAANAATSAGSFNVNLNLTSKCEINSTNASTGATVTDISLNYTSFQTSASTGSTNFSVRCTGGFAFTKIDLDAGGTLSTITDDVLGLGYTLNLSTSSTFAQGVNGTIASATPGSSGTTYYVHANLASGQAGTCASSSCTNSTGTNKNHTITVTY